MTTLSPTVLPPRMRRLFAVSLGATFSVVLLVVVVIALAPTPAEAANTCSLTSTAPTTNWTDATKWSGCGTSYPGAAAGDTAVIGLNGFTMNIDQAIANGVVLQVTGTSVNFTIPAGNSLRIEAGSSSGSANSININGGTLTAGSGTVTWGGNLTLGTGTLALAGTLQNATGAAYSVNGGTISGAGTLKIVSGTTLTFSGSGGGMNIDGAVIDAFGNVNYTSNSSQSLSLLNGANVKIESGSTLSLSGNDPIQTNNVGSPAIDILSGGAMSRGISGTLRIDAAVNNGGSLTNLLGRLDLYGGGSHSGAFSTATGGNTIAFYGAHVINAGSTAIGGGTYELDGGTFDVNTPSATPWAPTSFAQSGGTLQGTGTFRIGSTFTWTGGTQSNAGTTQLLGTTNINGASVTLTGGRVMTNSGTINYTPNSPDFLTIDGGARIDNTGTINLANDATIASSSPSTSYINNSGNAFFKKTGGSFSDVFCGLTLNGSSTLQPAAGTTLSLRGGSGPGTFGGSPTATIDLSGGSSEVYFAGGTFAVTGSAVAVTGSGELRLANAVLQVTSGPLTVNNFVQDGASSLLQSSGQAISVNGAGGVFTFDGGTIDGLSSGANTVTVNGPSGSLDFTGGSAPMILQGGAHIKNLGGSILFNPSSYNAAINSGAVLDNNSGGFTFSNNNAFGITTDNFSNPLFTNSGSVTKAANPNTVQVDVKFNSTTTLFVNGGTLRLMGGGTNSGSMIATNAADRIEIGAGTYGMTTGATIGGAGTFAVSAGALLNNNTALNITHFELAGSVNGGGAITANNSFKWLSGGFTGTGSMTIPSAITADATNLTGSPSIADGFTFNNNGNFVYNPTFSLTFDNTGSGGATFNNNAGATFDIQGNGTTIVNGAGHALNNAGTIKKSAGAGVFTFTVKVANSGSGVIDEQFGSGSTIALNNGGNSMSGGTIEASNAAGKIELTGGSLTVTGGSFAGPGAINLKGAILGINAAQTFPPIFNFSSGTINGIQTIDIPSGAAFNWSGGTITGAVGAPITVQTGGTLNADTTTSSLIFDARPLLINAGGNFNWNAGTNSLIFQSGAPVSDLGNFTVTTNATLGSATAGSFSVVGNFTHNAAGTLNVTLPMSAAAGGIITSSGSGVLALISSVGGTHNGTLDAQSGSFLEFGGGTHQLNAGAAFGSGTGTIKLTAGTLNLLTNVAASNFGLIGGALSGSGNLDAQNFSWAGGQMAGSGTTSILSSGSFTGTGPLTLNRPLVIGGPTSMNVNAGLSVGGTATVTNNSTFDDSIGDVLCSACTTASFVNNGSIHGALVTNFWTLPVTGAGSASISLGKLWFQAAASLGSLTLNSGNVQFSGSPIAVGSVSAPAFSNLIVTGGTTTVSGAVTGTGCQVQITGGTLTLDGSSAIEALTLSGGTLSGAGAVTLANSVHNWNGGSIAGSGTITVDGGMNITGSSGAMTLARSLTNIGTMFYNPPNASQALTVSAPILNNGTFNVVGNFDLLAVGAPMFTNSSSGTLNRGVGGGAINFGPAVTNAGNSTWSVGTTTFTNGYTQTGGNTTLNGATIGSPTPFNFNGGVFNAKGTVNGSVVINGATLNPGTSPGAVTITGNYTQSSTGTLNAEINGTVAGTSYDQVNVGGNATLGGALNVTLGYSPSNGDTYDIVTIGGTRSGDFATKNIPTLPPPGTINASYIAGPPEKLRLQAVIPNPDLTLAVSAPGSVLHGQNATITYTINNVGATSAGGVTFADTLTNASVVSITSVGPCTTTPISCTIGTLAAGGSTNVVMQVNATAAGAITSNATVSASTADPTPGNNNTISTITVSPASDFGVLSVAAPPSVNAGANMTVSVTVKNGGPDAGAPSLGVSVGGGTLVSASGGGFTCSVTPSGASCTGSSITVNGTATLTLSINAQNLPGSVTVSATTSSAADPNGGNNSGSSTTSIGNVADLSVIKTGPATANAGATITYNVTVTNNGPSDAAGVQLSDPTPARLTPVSVSGAGCTTFPCSLGTLPAGQTVGVQATYTVDAGPPVTIFNLATATTTTLDPNPNNDAGAATTAVGCGGSGPTPISPAANGTVGSPATFTWSAVPGAVNYTVNANIGGTVITLGPTTATTISGTLPDGSGFWNVSANFGGNCTAVPSANVPLVVCSGNASPVLRMVSEALSGQAYRAEWDALPGATGYEIDESGDASFTTVTTSNLTGTSVTFQHNVSTPAPFFYRVRALLPCIGKFGPNSAAARVVVTPPPAPDDPNPNVNVPVGNTKLIVQLVHVPGFPGGSVPFTAAVDKPWLSVSPTSGILPSSGFDFTVTADPANLPNGTFTGTVLVTVVTPTNASRVIAAGETTAKAPVSVSLVTPVSPVTKSGAPPANALIIPSVGHLGGINSTWRSDIRLANTGVTKVKYQLTFTPTGEDASKPVKQTTIDVDAGATTALDDIVRNWYGIGSLGEAANGVLEIRPLNTANKGGVDPQVDVAFVTAVSSRTYNVSAQGTLGQFIPAVPFASFVGKAAAGALPTILGLQQIAQNSAFRTNLGLVEAAGKPATVLVNVFDGAGKNVFSQVVDLAAGEQKQLNSFLAADDVTLADGRIEVQVTGGDGRITAYASRVDNGTGDPLLVTGTPLRGAGASHYVLPGVAMLDTGFANWQSDVRMFNASEAPVTATVTYYPQNNSGDPTATAITVNPGETKQLDNVLQSLFGLTNTGGALHVTTPAPSSFIISGRTFNQTSNGTFGQFIPAVTSDDAVGAGGRALQILQAEESVRYRTNVGIAEVTGKSVVVEVSAFLPDSKISPRTQFTLGPNEFRQFNVLHDMGLDNVYNARIQLRVLSGEGKVVAYGSTIDMLTQDPTYIPAQQSQ